MHGISLLDHSSDYVLCQLRNNDKRKLSDFETKQEAISNDSGASVRKLQRSISGKNKEGDPSVLNNSQTLAICEAKAISASNERSLEHAVGNCKAVPDLPDDSNFVDEIMEPLNKKESLIDETDTSASVEINLLHPIGDSETIVSGRSNIEETEICTLPATTAQSQPTNSLESLSFIDNPMFSSIDEVLEYFDCEKWLELADQDQLVPHEEQPEIALTSQASLAFDMCSKYVEAVEEQCDLALISPNWTSRQSPLLGNSARLSEAYVPVASFDTNADYAIDWTQFSADDPGE